MITLEDIANATFRKAKIGGYNPEDVNEFLDQVQESFAQMQKEKMELVRKLEILAKKVEEYREEEESIRNTLFSAQKLADASVREAKHKSEVILKDASAKAEKIVNNAQTQIIEQQETLLNLQREVSSFRSRLLAIYKEHLTLINALPTEEEKADNAEVTISTEESKQPDDWKAEASSDAATAPFVPVETPSAAQVIPEAAVSPVEKEPMKAAPFTPEPAPSIPVQPQPAPEDFLQSNMPAAEEPETRSKFGELKFGKDYNVKSDEEESPLGLFKHKNKY